MKNQTCQKDSPVCANLIKLLGVFCCCATISILFYYIVAEICVLLGVSINLIRPYRIRFIDFGVTICTPIWYLWFIDKKLGSTIRSGFSFCSVSFLITNLIVIIRIIYCFLIQDKRLPILPTTLKEWAFTTGGDLYRASSKALDHLNSLSDLFLEGILPFVIIAGIGEELIFRGILQNIFLNKTKKPSIAILIASTLFTVTHGSLYYSIQIFLMGLLLGIIYHITNNIYLVIFAHMLNNFIYVLLMYFLKEGLILGPISISTHNLSIFQLILGVTICICCIVLLLKKLIVVQRNIDIPPTL